MKGAFRKKFPVPGPKCKFIVKPGPGLLKILAAKRILDTIIMILSEGDGILFFQRFQRFMYGRYGTDQLSMALLVLGLALSLCGSLFFWPLTLAADALYVYTIFRMFSRNIPARQREYYAFLKVWGPVQGWFRLQKRKWGERKLYRYFRCPQCKQQLRAPRGRGKIEVTCQKCHTVFQTKT